MEVYPCPNLESSCMLWNLLFYFLVCYKIYRFTSLYPCPLLVFFCIMETYPFTSLCISECSFMLWKYILVLTYRLLVCYENYRFTSRYVVETIVLFSILVVCYGNYRFTSVCKFRVFMLFVCAILVYGSIFSSPTKILYMAFYLVLYQLASCLVFCLLL